VAAATIAISLLFLGASLLDLPALVPRVTAVNPGEYQVNVDVGRAGHAGSTDLGTLDREATKVLEEIADQGPTWVFRFSYGKMPVGELTVSRIQLERDGWKFTVPPEVTGHLRAAGRPPSSR